MLFSLQPHNRDYSLTCFRHNILHCLQCECRINGNVCYVVTFGEVMNTYEKKCLGTRTIYNYQWYHNTAV